MNEKEATIQMLTMGKKALITAIMALKIDYNVYGLECLRDEVNRKIENLKIEIKYE